MKFMAPISAVMFLEGYTERGTEDARAAVAYLKQALSSGLNVADRQIASTATATMTDEQVMIDQQRHIGALWNLVDRAVKMFMMAVPDGQGLSKEDYNPIKAWLADAVAALKNNAPVAQSEQRPSRPQDGATSDASRCTTSPSSSIAATSERTPADYAIEHGGYLAKAAEDYMKAAEKVDQLELCGAAEEAIQKAEEARSDHYSGLRLAIYEFRKRAERAMSQRSATKAPNE